jgi:hypothetical protein
MGATLLEPEWLSKSTPHRVRCANGHECCPRPANVNRGAGLCRACVNSDPATAEAVFRARVAELGAIVVGPYRDAKTRVHVRCSMGHDCYPVPDKVRQGRTLSCRICSGRPDSATSSARFRARLAELGVTLLEAQWLGAKAKHRAICAAGHECNPVPATVIRGGGACLACSERDPATAAAAFHAKIAELGGTVLGEYVSAHRKIHIRCAVGHDCYPTPHTVRRGGIGCPTCAGNDPAACEARFLSRLEKLNATPLYERWLGSGHPHAIRCGEGHECRPRPSDVLQGHGICITCTGKDPRTAEAAFRRRLAELGAVPLYETWLGTNRPHHVRCAVGHDCYSRPAHVRDGGGVCQVCAGHDTVAAEAAFRERLTELGAEPLYETWLGGHVPHHARCRAGHDCYPRPTNAQRWGICKACLGRDPQTLEAAFRFRLAELGADLLESEWLGALRKHRIRCGAGHDGYVKPNQVQQGYGICKTCAGHDPVAAAAAFRARLAELGATLLEPEWLGSDRPHQVRCSEGHLCRPAPGNVSQGNGICRVCRGCVWDAFYVVASAEAVKFGITSGDPRPRLGRHAAQGFMKVVRLATGLPGTIAHDTERAVISALAMAGEVPVQGREYFNSSCLALVLDIADSWLAKPALSLLADGCKTSYSLPDP